jgi:hypothetical protein
MLRPISSRRRGLLGKLCHIVEQLLISAYSGTGVEGRRGLVLFVQTLMGWPGRSPILAVIRRPESS